MKIKKKLKKLKKKFKKTQGEINKTQEDFNLRFDDIVNLIKRREGVTFMLRASYKGVLKKDEYQFTLFSPYHLGTSNGWYLMP